VTRVPEIDFGGVLAEQRNPEKVVLDALRRLPDTGFATHDRARTKEELLAERAEHQAILATRPPDRAAGLRRAQQQLQSAEKGLHCARQRLKAAQECLDRLGPLSQLRRHARHGKVRTLDEIDRFAKDVTKAEALITERPDVSGLQAETAKSRAWIEEHSWRDGRLRAVERELAEVHCYIPLLDLTIDLDLPATTATVVPAGNGRGTAAPSSHATTEEPKSPVNRFPDTTQASESTWGFRTAAQQPSSCRTGAFKVLRKSVVLVVIGSADRVRATSCMPFIGAKFGAVHSCSEYAAELD
jgi:hypothetical protein